MKKAILIVLFIIQNFLSTSDLYAETKRCYQNAELNDAIVKIYQLIDSLPKIGDHDFTSQYKILNQHINWLYDNHHNCSKENEFLINQMLGALSDLRNAWIKLQPFSELLLVD